MQQSQITADGTALKSTEYLYEPDTFRPMAQVETNHQTGRERLHYIVTDHAGTPQELCSPTGEIEWRGDQALWGNYYQRTTKVNRGYREEAANDVIHCDLRYQGQLEDTESGLYYNLNRYYDADSGQYLSPDPIGFSGGLRPQAYVFNPMGWVDPLGLTGESHGTKGPLDWGGTDREGLSRKDHVRRHGVDDPTRNVKHGVFNENPINQTADAWKRAKDMNLQPQVQGNKLVYDVPSPNAGIQGGNSSLEGHGQTLNKIRIVTESGSNRVITAFPIE